MTSLWAPKHSIFHHNEGTIVYRPITVISLAAMLTIPGFVVAGAGEELRPEQLDRVNVARAVESRGDSRSSETTSLRQAKASLPLLNPNPRKPEILLSSQHQQQVVKQLGDVLEPTSQLQDVAGQDVVLRDALSDRLTVLIFWSEKSVAGYEQFRRIPVDVLARFAPHRVKVVTINVGGTVKETQRLTGKAADKILSLADTESKLLKQFAKAGVPRTYVLDAQGRVLWYDIEFSESTRRELDNALTYYLQKSASPPKPSTP